MYFIFGNYGDNTIALIEWCHLHALNDVTVVNVDTGWGAVQWQARIKKGRQLAEKYHFKTITLNSSTNFETLVRDRGSFPNAKYQWCPTFLKALPFLSWLEEEDMRSEATIVLGARRADSRTRRKLPEFIEESEHYGERKVWYPLYTLSTEERDKLILQAGFEVLNHRSLECNPCIHNTLSDFKFLEKEKITTLQKLENEMGQTMFHRIYPNLTIEQISNSYDLKETESIDMGCGSHFACGE